MAKLLGFQKRSGTGEASSDQMIRILEKTYLNRTPNGEFTNTGEVQGLIDALSGMAQTPDVMEKIADLENTKLKFQSRQTDIMNSKAVFEDNLEDALRVEARNNYKDLGQLIGNYMNVYADAEENIDQYINDNVYQRYGASAVPPQELLDLKDKIKEKARYYSTLTALIASPEGMDNLNAEGLGVKVQTNPLTGNIISLDVVPRGEIGDDFMQTDIKGRIEGGDGVSIPMYINAQDDKVTDLGTQTRFARLGSMEFRGVKDLEGGAAEKKERTKELGDEYGVGTLKAQNEHRGLGDWLKGIFTETDAETANKGLESARNQGLTFKDFNFDGNDIPSQSVVRKGNRLYFQQENGDLSEFEGSTYAEKDENARKYLQQIGADPNKANVPFYADDVYFVAPDGSSRIKEKIGKDYFMPPTPPTSEPTAFSPLPAPTQATAPQENQNLLSSFFGNTNRPNLPNTKTETTTPSIIEKGKSFFRSKFS